MLMGYCCCEQTCLIYQDYFDSDLSGWDQVSGTWSISSGRLTTSSTNAQILIDQSHTEAEHILSGVVKGAYLDIARFIVAYASSSNYLYAEIRFGSSAIYGESCGYIRLYQVTGAGTSLLKSIDAASIATNWDINFLVCYSATEGIFSINLNALDYYGNAYLGANVASLTGQQVGLGTGGTAASISFDAVNWHKHQSATYSECSNCTDYNKSWGCAVLYKPQGTFNGLLLLGITYDDLGCWWTEEIGNWVYTTTTPDYSYHTGTETIHCLATEEAGLLYYNKPNPLGSLKQYLNVSFYLPDENGIEVGAFIQYNPSSGYYILCTAEKDDDEVIFRIYDETLSLSDTDTLDIITLPYWLEPDGRVFVNFCIEYDGTNVTFKYLCADLTYYRLSNFYPWAIAGPHSMYCATSGVTSGYYFGYRVLDNPTQRVDFVSTVWGFSESEISNCYTCGGGCIVLENEIPCYLSLTFSNFKDNTSNPCSGGTKDCSDVNGTWGITWQHVSEQYESASFNYEACYGALSTYWYAYFTYEYFADQDRYEYTFNVRLYYPYSLTCEWYHFRKRYGTSFPNVSAWSSESIPLYDIDPASTCSVCADMGDPPVCLVNNV